MPEAYPHSFSSRLRSQPLRHLARLAAFQLALRHPARSRREKRLRHENFPAMAETPACLRPPPHRYLDYAGPWVADTFCDFLLAEQPATPLVYLPVFWAAIYHHIQTLRYTPAEAAEVLAKIRATLHERLDPAKTYFTILEYDHTIWDWHEFPKNVCVLSAGGGGDVAIPWLKGSPALQNPPKDILCSFYGTLDGASDHGGVRSRMHEALKDFAIFGRCPDWHERMGRSEFSLCPRGLGRASYRLYEALSVSSIPICIWDDQEWIPYSDELPWEDFCLSVHADDLASIPHLIAAWSEDRRRHARELIAQHYDDYFTLPGVCRQILRFANSDPAAVRAIMEKRE